MITKSWSLGRSWYGQLKNTSHSRYSGILPPTPTNVWTFSRTTSSLTALRPSSKRRLMNIIADKYTFLGVFSSIYGINTVLSKCRSLVAVLEEHERRFGIKGDGVILGIRGLDGFCNEPASWLTLEEWGDVRVDMANAPIGGGECGTVRFLVKDIYRLIRHDQKLLSHETSHRHCCSSTL